MGALMSTVSKMLNRQESNLSILSRYPRKPTCDYKIKFKIIFLISFLLFGCGMNDKELTSFIIGTWRSEPRESEWGLVVMEFQFTANNTYKAKGYFGENKYPLDIRGNYKIKDSKLLAADLNKGEPILITVENKDLILDIEGESIKLTKVSEQ